MEHLDTFLAGHPPFDGIDADAAAQSSPRRPPSASFEPGETVLVEDGLPAAGLWVILTGSMELVHQGEVGPGARARASASAIRRC